MNVATLRGDKSQAWLAKELAKRLGKDSIDPTTITRLEAGKRPITVNELDALSTIFNVSLYDLTADPAVINDITEFRRALADIDKAMMDFHLAYQALEKARRNMYELLQLQPELIMAALGRQEDRDRVDAILRADANELLHIVPF